MKVLVYGAGAIGTYLGSRLASHNEVYLYGGRKLKEVGSNLEITTGSRKETENLEVPTVLASVGENEDYDVIFVATKLYGIRKAIKEIKEKNLKYKKIVFIQNGLVEREFYSELEKMGKIVRMTIYEGYRLDGSKLTAQENTRGWQIDPTREGEEIARLLNESEILAEVNPEIQDERAKKTLIVVAAAGLCVLEDKKIGELLDDTELREKMLALLKEGYGVLSTEFKIGQYDEVEKELLTFLETVREHYPSMYQDIKSGRETEIEFLNGLIVKLGSEKKISTPLNQEVYFRVKRLVDYRDENRESIGEFKLK